MLWSFRQIKRHLINRYRTQRHEMRRIPLFAKLEALRRHVTMEYHRPHIGEIEREALAKLKADIEKTLATFPSATAQQIFGITGMALSTWARMEQRLVGVAFLLLGTSLKKTGLVMYSIINFQVWISIIGELFTLEPQFTELKPKWNKISESLRAIKDQRDGLAHNAIDYGDDSVPPVTVELKPAKFDSRMKSQKFKPMEYHDILSFIDDVSDISDRLDDLLDAMMKKLPSSPEKSAE